MRRFDRDKLDNGYRRHRMVSALTLLKSEDSPIVIEKELIEENLHDYQISYQNG